jgi:hypothetical protein
MLGRIFENLLAEINPETQKTARKATGSYYTPRPIVEYMVDESLIQYLLTNLETFGTVENLPNGSKDNAEHCEGLDDKQTYRCEGLQPLARSLLEQKIRNLLDYTIEENELSKDESLKVIESLDKIKILDPACGSGAFPMGILQKMLLIRQKVDPESIEWVMKQLEKIPDKLVRKALEEKLMDENWDYKYKMSAILHSIYGVDIQPIAVELSKLRFFLTLMVDETVNDEKKNRGINELPNLSFKFVAANTLIGLPEAGKDEQMDLMDFDNLLDPMIKKLEDLREKFFYASGKEKDRIENDFKKTQTKIGQFLGKEGSTNKRAVALANWDPFADKSSDWFDPKWMFGIKEGFDIVIANPPYVTYHGRRRNLLSNEMLKYFRNKYSCILDKTKDGKYNSLMFFIEKFIQIGNSSCVTSFIIDVSFFEHFYNGVKKLLLTNTNIVTIVTELSSFENVASGQLIIIAQKVTAISSNKTKWIVGGIDSKPTMVDQKIWKVKENHYQFYLPGTKTEESIISKIIKNGNPLVQYFPNKLIRTGESVGVKENGFVVEQVNSKDKIEYYNYLEGGKSIPSRYSYPKPTRYFRFDVILLNLKNLAYRNEASKAKRKNPKVLGIGDKEAFDNPKVLIRQSCDHLCATYTDKAFVYNRSFYSISSRNSSGQSQMSLLFILSLLNSKLLQFYSVRKRVIKKEKGKQPQIRLSDLKQIPIADHNEKYDFENIAIEILYAKKSGKDTQKLEDKIDLMVYKLYELTYDEAKIVDPQLDDVLAKFGLSREDYERIGVEKLGELSQD